MTCRGAAARALPREVCGVPLRLADLARRLGHRGVRGTLGGALEVCEESDQPSQRSDTPPLKSYF